MARLQFKHGLLKMPTAWTSENLTVSLTKEETGEHTKLPVLPFPDAKQCSTLHPSPCGRCGAPSRDQNRGTIAGVTQSPECCCRLQAFICFYIVNCRAKCVRRRVVSSGLARVNR